MTTIAYKDRVIAYDSRRVIDDDCIYSDSAQKQTIRNGIRYFTAGQTAEVEAFIEAHQAGTEFASEANMSAIIVDGDKAYHAGVHNHKIWLIEIPDDHCVAIGSGRHNAYTAMDMGADAETAVKMAMKRDTSTGGIIRTYTLK